MFCLCCRPSGGFFAEGVAEPVPDFARALQRRAAYERRTSYSRAPVAQPGQTEFVIRDAAAVTMDPQLGDLTRTDIHVRDGAIAGIGRNLPQTSAVEIDGVGLTAMPGLVAAHRHPASDRLNVVEPDAAAFRDAVASDVYRALRLALLDLTSAGFTSVHVCGADLGAGHAETAVLAQIDSGIRGRFSFPLGGASGIDETNRCARQLHETWFTGPVEHLLDLGVSADGSDSTELLVSHRLPLATAHHSDADAVNNLSSRTLGAARRLELDQWIGSLSPQKRADIILVRGEPADGLAPGDVEFVAIDGRIKKRDGALCEPNEVLIRNEGLAAIGRLRKAAAFCGVEGK